MSAAPPPTLRGRREVLARLGAGAAALALGAGCEMDGGAAQASPGSYASVRDLAGWRPGGAPAWAEPEATVWEAASGGPLHAGDPLAPLRQALRELEAGRAREPVLIVQFGDSHTAGPFFVARLRELFQDRYGRLGPGRLPPGRAPRYYRPALVQVEQEGGGWSAASALRASNPGPFGIAGYRLRGEQGGSRITLRSTEPEGFDRFTLDLMVQPGGGSFRIALDDEVSPEIRSAQPQAGPATIPLHLPRRYREARVELKGDGPVDLLGWGVERRGGGVIVEGHGINGATVEMLGNLDQTILKRDLMARPPALIILAYGTNEAVDPAVTEDGYAATLTAHVRRLKRYAPRSAILLVGAPDSARRAGGGHRLGRLGGGGARFGAAAAGGGACAGWAPLPSLAEVKAAQRRVAGAERLAFWDWAEVTGGVCGLDAMTRRVPKLVQDDHIHFTAEGYRLSAERLFARIAGRGGAGSAI